MDIQKEAFESNFKKTEIYRRECAIRGKDILEFSKTMGGYFNIVANDAWNMWQAAKAQAVPEVITIGNELQSWVAVWSFSAKNEGEDYVVVDANLLAEKIEGLTGANQ
jgi:hypothetical protein